MSASQTISSTPFVSTASRALLTFTREILYVLSSIMDPRGVMEEIEGMLLRQADDIEATDPAHAQTLRVHARQMWQR